jgi:hypothetical protein
MPMRPTAQLRRLLTIYHPCIEKFFPARMWVNTPAT